MPSPDMIDGMRAPRSVRLDDIRKGSEALSALPTPGAAPAGVTVYVSPYRKYRVQVTAPRDYIGPDGRRITGGKMIVAEFDEGVYRNNDRDPAVRALIDESLQANPYFGKFGGGPKVHFWLASDQHEAMEAGRIKAAVATLKSLPKEVVDEYLRQGSGEDHELPPDPRATEGGASAQRSAKPIKPAA